MNDLHILREWDAEAPPLTDEARLRARARLFQVIAGGPAPTTPPVNRRPWLRMALATSAVLALVTTAVVALNDYRDPPLVLSASAATVLNGAAAREREHEKVIAPRDDQFIYTKEIMRETDQKSGETQIHVNENWRSVDDSQRSWVMEIGQGWWSEPQEVKGSLWPPADWDALKKLPTDPDKLIVAVNPPRTQPDPDEWPNVHFALAGLLRLTPVMPPGLRAAAYEALAKIPGVTATPGVRDAKGRTGIAISYENPDAVRQDSVFIFAEDTYEFLGFRDTRTSSSGGEKKTYTQLSYLDSYAVVDRAKQRPKSVLP